VGKLLEDRGILVRTGCWFIHATILA
jgi:hypothetical protein